MKRSVSILVMVLSVWLLVPSAMAEMTMKQVEQVLQNDPNNIAALFQKARLLEQQNKLDEAIAIYQRIIKLEPKRPEAYNNLAALYVKQGKLEEARKVLQQGMQTHSVYATMQQNLVLINREMAARSYASAMVNVERKVQLTQIDKLEEPQDNTTLLASAADDAEKRKQAEAERKHKAEEKRKAEELARQQEEERQRKLAEQNRKQELARKQEEKRQRKLAEQKRKEELARKQEEERQRKLEAKRKAEQELARKREEERQRQLAQLELEKQRAASKAQSQDAIKKEVTQRVLDWAAAWSSQDALSYIGFYINGYRPNASTSHSDWVKQRKYRLRSPQWIKVKLENIQVDIIDENTVTVRFLQRYRSNTYQDAGYKQLTLVKVNGEWKIREEKVVRGQ